MNDLVDDVGDVTGLPDRLVSSRVLRDRGSSPLELETVAPVDGIVPANTNFSQEAQVDGWGGATLSVKYYPLLLKFIFSVVVQFGEQKTRNNIQRDCSQLHCFETIP